MLKGIGDSCPRVPKGAWKPDRRNTQRNSHVIRQLHQFILPYSPLTESVFLHFSNPLSLNTFSLSTPTQLLPW